MLYTWDWIKHYVVYIRELLNEGVSLKMQMQVDAYIHLYVEHASSIRHLL